MTNPFLEIIEKLKKLESPPNTQTLDNTQKYSCEICQDRELIISRDKDGMLFGRRCECSTRKNIMRLIKSSMLPEEMLTWKFDNYTPTKATQALYSTAKEYADNFDSIKKERGNGFGFIGPVGVGKTHLMASIANELLNKDIPVVFVNTTQLIYELRQAEFKKDKADDIDCKVETLQNAEVVLFDDLAKEKSSEWTQMQYYRIIDHRYTHRKPTGWTTNCSIAELGDKLGDATTSRLIHMCGGATGRVVVIGQNAEDWRMRGTKPKGKFDGFYE